MRDRDRPVLILGAGINGAALARELVLNGVAVCVVDVGDISSGTTACSTRLIHGGLRYLEYAEWGLVRESLHERTRWLRLAPHLVRPLRLFVPVGNRPGGLGRTARRLLHMEGARPAAGDPRGLWLVRAGLRLYDQFARDPALPRSTVHRVGDAGTPEVDPARFRWLCSYSDAQARFPELLTVALLEDARQAAAERGVAWQVLPYHAARLHGARVAVHRRDPFTTAGPVTIGPAVQDLEPLAIVNATGAWVDRTLQHLPVDARRLIGGTKGSHLLTFHPGLRRALAGAGLYVEAADGRPVFLLPLGDATLVGTTDLPFEGDPAEARASEEELDYLLSAANATCPGLRLSRDDIALHYCGVRPLPYSPARATAGITRRHWLEEHAAARPLFSLVGGKLTTCRALAEQATRAVLDRVGLTVRDNSRERPLPGAAGWPQGEVEAEGQAARLAAQFGVPRRQAQQMALLAGSRVADILAAGVDPRCSPGPELPLPSDFVRWVIRSQWVTTLGDLVERRLMLLYEPELSAAALHALAELMRQEGVLAAEQVPLQVAACRDRLRNRFGKELTAAAGDSPVTDGAPRAT